MLFPLIYLYKCPDMDVYQLSKGKNVAVFAGDPNEQMGSLHFILSSIGDVLQFIII